MTRKPAWKNVETKRNGSGTVAGIFVVFVLFGFLAFGFIKNLHIGANKVSRAGANTYLAILGTKPTSLFAFQKETAKAAIFTLDDEKKVISGVGAGDLVKIDELKNRGDGLSFLNSMTLAFRAKISNYILFKDAQAMRVEDIKKELDKFTSYRTLIAILFRGEDRDNIKSTNITRFDEIKLWWQLKSVRTENIKITDLGGKESEKSTSDGQKVLGVDEASLNRSLQDFSQSDEVTGEYIKVTVNNPSKNQILSQLAVGFVDNIGADLREVREDGVIVEKTIIYTDRESSKTARYLATIFNCDIKRLPETENQDTVLVVLGSDFGNIYLK